MIAATEAASHSALYDYVWVVPALPAASFLLILLFGKRLRFKGAEIGIAAVGLACLYALATTFTWIGDIQSAQSENEEQSLTYFEDETAAGVGSTQVQLTADDGARGAPIINEMEWFGIGEGAAQPVLVPEGDDGDHSESASFSIPVGTHVDGQSVMLLFVVTIVSLLVHIYSTDYVHGDRRYTHYFAFLSLFTASMLFMVLSSSTLQLIVGWELVGVCSFALIGHWWEDKPNSDAALKAFLTNRVGDIGLLIGMTILFFAAGTFSINKINEMAVAGEISTRTLGIAAACLMAAVMSKSGQFILHTWLPDAMAGPTPVSALIHAATMVVAGIYMIARLYPVFFIGFGIDASAATAADAFLNFEIFGSNINLMAFVGGLTTVGGGALAFVQRDIKKVLAYSTVSQLGYMVLALGVGAYTAALFHLFTHAFFKACLFLGAGSVSHACHHSFDMKADMGGLRKYMPKTFWTFIIGSAALAGLPPLAGFWSKDEILTGAGVWPDTGGNGTYTIPFIFGMLTAAMTAAYMTRTVWLTFFGDYRGHEEPHESGPRITTPLLILAGMATLVGFLNVPSGVISTLGLPSGWAHKFEDWVEPAGIASFPKIAHAKPSLTLALVATGLALLAGWIVWNYYKRLYAIDPKATEYTNGVVSKSGLAKAGHTVLVEKYYLDHLYTGVIAGSVKGVLARAAYWFNQNVIDGIVDFVGRSSAAAGRFIYRFIDQGVVDGAVNASGQTASRSGQLLRAMQSGQIREYASLMFGAAAVLAAVFIFALS